MQCDNSIIAAPFIPMTLTGPRFYLETSVSHQLQLPHLTINRLLQVLPLIICS